jgi:hypothetical protein
MAVRPSRLPRDTRTILRAIVAPFVIGGGSFVGSVWLAHSGVFQEYNNGMDALLRAFFFAVGAAFIAGALAAAVSGRDNGWLGFVSATAGVAAGIVAVFLYAYGAALLDHLASVLICFGVSWVVLTFGYAVAHARVRMVSGPRPEPARWGAAPLVAPRQPGPSWPTVSDTAARGDGPRTPAGDANKEGPGATIQK